MHNLLITPKTSIHEVSYKSRQFGESTLNFPQEWILTYHPIPHAASLTQKFSLCLHQCQPTFWPSTKQGQGEGRATPLGLVSL